MNDERGFGSGLVAGAGRGRRAERQAFRDLTQKVSESDTKRVSEKNKNGGPMRELDLLLGILIAVVAVAVIIVVVH